MFLGTFTNKIDRKGRVSIPAEFRAFLRDSGSEGVLLFPKIGERAIEGGTFSYLDNLCEQWASLPELEREERTLLLTASAKPLDWDEGGRIVLPAELIEYAGLTDAATFAGARKSFLIWHPEVWADRSRDIAARALAARQAGRA